MFTSPRLGGRRASARLGTLLLVALLTVAPVSPALADRHNPDNVDPCADAPVFDQYLDREDSRDAHLRSVDCVIYRSIALGSTDDQGRWLYHPLREVTRAQMASFIAQTLDAAGYANALSDGRGEDEFDDISDSIHRRNINRLARAGIVRGTGEREYSVTPSITRQQMATFIVQAAEFALEQELDGDGQDRFTDVSRTNPHKANVENGADTTPPLFLGRSDTQFNPGQHVLRDQMATFLSNLLKFVFNPRTAPRPIVITVSPMTIRSGNMVTGEITGDGVTSASVSGACVTDSAVSDRDSARDGIQFSLPSHVDAQPGGCSLAFNVMQLAGDTEQSRTRWASVTIAERPPRQQTAAPEIVSAEFVRTTINSTESGSADDFEQTTVRFTFDDIVSESVEAARFHLVTFDGRRFAGQSSSVHQSKKSALVVFGRSGDPLGADEFSAVTAATVMLGAVQGTNGIRNPEGDAAVHAVALAGGISDAPDLASVRNFRPGMDTAEVTLVDFTFDEPAHVVDPAGFELVLVDNTEISCTAVPQLRGFQGDGTTTLTVACPLDANADQQIPEADVARGVVHTDVVSDTSQQSPEPEGAEGHTNALQATDLPDLASTAPDIASVALHADGSATFTFDQPVEPVGTDPAVTAARFRLYDRTGAERAGATLRPADAATPEKVVVIFGVAATDVAVGGAVVQDAVIATARNPQTNQDDEAPADNPAAFRAGSTVAPDLVDVERRVTGQSTDPISGETTETQYTFSFVFDEPVASVGLGMFLYEETGARLALTACAVRGGSTTRPLVDCVVSRDGGGADVNADGSDDRAEGLAAAKRAVLGTVIAGAVSDRGGAQNHDASRPVIDI